MLTGLYERVMKEATRMCAEGLKVHNLSVKSGLTISPGKEYMNIALAVLDVLCYGSHMQIS